MGGGGAIGDGECVIPQRVCGDSCRVNELNDVVRVVEGYRHVSEWGVVGGEPPGDGDVLPDVLLLLRGSRGYCSRDADVADGELGAHGGFERRIAGVRDRKGCLLYTSP